MKALIENTFIIIDQDNNGYLSKKNDVVLEFKLFLSIVESTDEYHANWDSDNLPDLRNHKTLETEALTLFDVIDIDNSGCIQFCEFMAAVTDISQYLEKDMVHMLIDLIDYDKSNSIELTDFGSDGLAILEDSKFWVEWVEPLHT